MGICICKNSNKATIEEVFLDYKHSSIMVLYSKNNLESFQPDLPEIVNKYASISQLNSNRFFIVGGKSSKGLVRTCAKIEPYLRKISYHSPLDMPSQKGYCFEYSDYLYYIFGKKENKENCPIQRLNIKENSWEKFFPNLPSGKERVSLDILDKAGVAFNNGSLYIVSGYIPRANTFSNTIFKLNLPDLTIENLGFKFENQLLKPFPLFISDELFIFHKKSSKSSKLIKLNQKSKSIELNLEQNNLKFKSSKPYYRLSDKELIIYSDPKIKFSLINQQIIEKHEGPDPKIEKRRKQWEEITIEERNSKETKINPIYCDFNPQILINYSSSTAPVIELPSYKGQQKPFNPFPVQEEIKLTTKQDKSSSNSSKALNLESEPSENGILANRVSQMTTIKGSSTGVKHSLYPPSNYNIRYENDRGINIDNYALSQGDSSGSDLSQKHSKPKGKIVDRSGKLIKPEEFSQGQEIILDSPVNPFPMAGSIDNYKI